MATCRGSFFVYRQAIQNVSSLYSARGLQNVNRLCAFEGIAVFYLYFVNRITDCSSIA